MSYVLSCESKILSAVLGRPEFAHFAGQGSFVEKSPAFGLRGSRYIQIEALGRLWNISAHSMPVSFAYAAAEAHRGWPGVYGRLDHLMDIALTVGT